MPKYATTKTFLVGESQTPSLLINEMALVGIIVSASTLTGTGMTFLVSQDNTNFYPLYNSESTEVSITTGSYSKAYSLNPVDFLPWNYVKGRLGTSASSVLQTTYNTNVIFIVDSM